MRVLNVLFDDRFAGPQKRVILIASALRRHGVETVLCVPARDGDAPAAAENEGIAVRRVPCERIPRPRELSRVARWLFSLPGDTRRFLSLFRRERPEVVHVNGAFFWPPVLAARLARAPLLWHLNDIVVPRPFAPLFGALVRLLANQVVVSSEAVAAHYGVLGTAPAVFYPPVQPDPAAVPRRRTGCDPRPFRVGLIAHWNAEKGIEYFVRAAARVREQLGDKLEVVFAGAKYATQRDYCQRVEELIRKLGLNSCIRDYGFVPSVGPVLRELDVLVSSSVTEAFGMSALEAMAAGVPVVATEVGGLPELLLADPARPGGILVPPKDEAALAAAILELWRDPARAAQLGEQGRQVARERFALDLCAQRHLEVYSKMQSRGAESRGA